MEGRDRINVWEVHQAVKVREGHERSEIVNRP
jgi:hypothetical protein